jgi:hypothetical protein
MDTAKGRVSQGADGRTVFWCAPARKGSSEGKIHAFGFFFPAGIIMIKEYALFR